MFRNYLKISLRNSIKDWQYSLTNIVGLALGIAAFLFIIQFVQFESKIDDFHEEGDRIYKLYSDLKWNSMEARMPNSPPALGTAITANFPEVEHVTRIRAYYHTPVKVNDEIFLESNTLSVDSNFLKVFSFPLLEGDIHSVFRDPSEVVLASHFALKYFGQESALGKNLEIDGKIRTVSGVIADPRLDSHINYGIILPLQADEGVKRMEWSWLWSNMNTYLKLVEGAEIEQLAQKLPSLVENNAGAAIERITGSSLKDFVKNGNRLSYFPVPLNELYYDSDNQLGPSGNKLYLAIFTAIAFIIIFLACINYINLATARSMKRAKEVGIRKVVGSSRSDLIFQFLLEALIFSMIASFIAVAIGIFLDAQLSTAFDIRWNLSPVHSTGSFIVILLTTFGVSLICGSYPAIYLSSFQPARTLKGKESVSTGAGAFRRFLVVLQFVTSFAIITMSFTANRQLDFLKTRDLGFVTDRLLVIHNADFLQNQAAFKAKAVQRADIENGSLSSFVPGIGGNFEVFKKVGAWDEDYAAYLVDTDEDFFKTFGIEIIEGQSFDYTDINKAEKRVVINDLAVKMFDLEQPVGAKIMALDDGAELTVSGVMEPIDFFMSQSEQTEAVIRPHNDSTAIHTMGYLTLRLNTSDYESTLSAINDLWVDENTGIGFSYQFYDQIFDDRYSRENRLSGLMNIFSILAIFIAILGLIGLISYNAEQARKMIGIRKVFGASVSSILYLLTWDYLKLLLLAFLISIPIINYFMKDWLAEFTYQIEINAWLFVIPGLILLIVAFASAWTQTYRAAIANPVDSIGGE